MASSTNKFSLHRRGNERCETIFNGWPIQALFWLEWGLHGGTCVGHPPWSTISGVAPGRQATCPNFPNRDKSRGWPTQAFFWLEWGFTAELEWATRLE